MRILCSVSTQHSTGVEMEALVGASTAALALYDMCKAAGGGRIAVGSVVLLEKTGGKADFKAELLQ